MANPNTSEKSNALDREENITKGLLAAKRVAVYSYDSATDTLVPGVTVNNTTTSPTIAVDTFGSAIYGSRYNQIEIDYSTADPDAISTITVTKTSGGDATTANGQATFTSGTNTSGGVKVVTNTNVSYRPHAETYAAFTAIFTTGIANSYQRIGLYDTNNGFFIGYEGTSFGVTKRVSGSDTFTQQSSFSVDTLTGLSTSLYTRNGTPEAADFTKDNLFRIRFGWLGAAPIVFEILSPDGAWVAFHKIKHPNTNAIPSVANPNLPITLDIQKTTAGATTLIMSTACWAAGSTSNFIKLTDTLNDNTLAGLTRSVITGRSTAGGTTYENVKVSPSGAVQIGGDVNASLKNNATIKFASVSVSTSGDNTIVTAVTGVKIKVLSVLLVASGNVSVKWVSNTTDLTGAMPLVVNSGFVLPASSPGAGHYFETAVGQGLKLNLSSAVAVNGHISYYEEA